MNDNLEKLFNESTKMPIIAGVVSFVAGAAAGFGVSYILNRRKFPEETFPYEVPTKVLASDEDVEVLPTNLVDEIQVRLNDAILDEEAHLMEHGPEDVGKAFVEKVLEAPTTIVPEPEEVVETPVDRNVFAGSDSEWDYERELARRTSTDPYIIHRDEFYANELDYTQITLTYYAGDNTLVDKDDHPIYNIHQVVGEMKFGHGSGDPNVVHIRNDRMKAEYEIIRDSGQFAIEVLGLEAEDHARQRDLKHSHHTPRFVMDE